MALTDGGVKLINIEATTRYPVVSAFEFEFLKTEALVRERMTACTLYVIVQRPLTYFTNVRLGAGELTFDIVDDVHEPLKCTLDLAENEITAPGEIVEVEVSFFKETPPQAQPFKDVAAIRVYRENGDFVVWYSPQKFLYELLVGRLEAGVEGRVQDYLDYHVHYIGKAFSQKVWDRLASHTKMQKILILEGPLSSKEARAPFEIALLLLEVEGFTEMNVFPLQDGMLPPGAEPIFHEVETAADFEAFNTPAIPPSAPQLTTEAEAQLINVFRPVYNEILFDNYPNIEGGTRSVGYTAATLEIDRLPFRLSTAHYSHPSALGENTT